MTFSEHDDHVPEKYRMTWYERHGSWWMLQWWHPKHGISFGMHLDWTPKVNAINGKRYSPYMDLHVGFCMMSVGVNPLWSSEVGQRLGRGGERAD